MPTPFVGLHLALAAIYGLLGLSFLLDPCGGGGDLCLGGYVGLLAIGLGAIGIGGVVVWRWLRRATPLLVWDAFIVAIGGFMLLASGGGGASVITTAALLALVMGVPGGILAGREVMRHRREPLFAFAAFAATFLLGIATGVIITVLGLLALAIGWLLNRGRVAPAT